MSAKRKVHVNNDLDIVMARMQTRDMAKQMGFSTSDQARVSLAASELARVLAWNNNKSGELVISRVSRNGHNGLQVVCLVNSAYVPTKGRADWAKETSIPSRSLAGACHLVDESIVEKRDSKHALVTLIKWLN